MKDMIRKTLECRKIDLFVDIHGHSRAKNLFIYGCSKLQNGPHTNGPLASSISNIVENKLKKNGILATSGINPNGFTNLSL